MSASKIEWTERTWNPIVGCSLKSPGCINCYAERQAHRLASNPATPHYAGTTKMSKRGPVFTGKVAMAPESTLLEPLRRKKPTTYFVNSMGDLFHESIPDEWIDRVFDVMARSPRHTFQILTKRAERMRDYSEDWLLPNVWLGVSAERQQEADERIPLLLQTPAAIRFVSAEPLIGQIMLRNITGKHPTSEPWHDHFDALHPQAFPRIDWVIVGGESGHNARPMHPEWARSLRDQCEEAGVAFFFKQWGTYSPCPPRATLPLPEPLIVGGKPVPLDGTGILTIRDANLMYKVGKKRAGRLLDGVEHNGMPTTTIKSEAA